MVRKISLTCAVAAALFFPISAFAGHGRGGHGGMAVTMADAGITVAIGAMA
jgi:hypothetical protein